MLTAQIGNTDRYPIPSAPFHVKRSVVEWLYDESPIGLPALTDSVDIIAITEVLVNNAALVCRHGRKLNAPTCLDRLIGCLVSDLLKLLGSTLPPATGVDLNPAYVFTLKGCSPECNVLEGIERLPMTADHLSEIGTLDRNLDGLTIVKQLD